MSIQRVKVAKDQKAEENVFANGCLVRLKTRCWGGYSRLDDSFIIDSVPKEMVRAVADLLADKTKLDIVRYIRDEAKRFICMHSLPSILEGFEFIPKEKIEHVDEGLKGRQERYFEAVEDFLAVYERLQQETAEKAPALYRPEKYPSVAAMRGHFDFQWYFRVFAVPDSSSSILPASVYKEEMRKFKEEIQEMKEMAVSEIGQQFLKKINKLKDQCVGGKIVSTATVETLHKFLDGFEGEWGTYFCHQELKKVINECKDYMVGTDAEMLRADDGFRDMIGNAMTDIADKFEKIGGTRVTRRLDI